MTAILPSLAVLSFLAFPLAIRASETDALVGLLENIPESESHAYRLRDNEGRNMDCLKVFQAEAETHGVVHGLYHTLKDGSFSIHLARSTDLLHWTHLRELDAHASQPTVHGCGNGAFLVAYEKDAPNSCWIRLRFYKKLSDLADGKAASERDIPRTLAPTAEGTPSIESIELTDGNPASSEIRLRFHFFKDARVDQLARGTLHDFKSWKAEPSDKINASLQGNGWRGNLGDRDQFRWNDQSYYLQEVQGTFGDWSSWRVCLCDAKGMPLKTLSLRTHLESTSFANPNATWIADPKGQKRLVVTLFLPSQGNAPAEAGSLLYVLDPSKSP